MQISSRFTIAVHIFACIDTFKDNFKVTSDFLASSVNVNPVIIRKIVLQLRNAGLGQCPVGRNIHNILDSKLEQVQNALENELKQITLAEIIKETQYYISEENKNKNNAIS